MKSPSRGFLPNINQPRDPATIADWLTIGSIVAVFGLRGEVKILSQTDFPDRLAQRAYLYIGQNHTPYAIQTVRQHGSMLIMQFAEITDATQAAKMCGQLAMIPQDEAADLAPDQYYIHDLIGLQVLHVDGHVLGIVVDVLTNGAQDLLKVRRNGGSDVFLPFVKALVPKVNITLRTITADPPIGLFDGEPEIG